MAKYVTLVKQRLGSFSAWKLKHVPEDYNEKADSLAVVAASLPIIETIFMPIYYQPNSSIAIVRVSQVDETSPSWIDRSTSTRENSLMRRTRLTRSKSSLPSSLLLMDNCLSDP